MRPTKRTFAYIGVLAIITLILFIYVIRISDNFSYKDLLFWGILSIVVESLIILLPNKDMGISVGSAINIASILVGGPFIGTATAVIGFLFRFPNIPGMGYSHLFNIPYYITVFNVSQASLVTSLMGIIYLKSGGTIGEFHILQTILVLFIGMVLNSIIISGLVSITNEEHFINVWIEGIRGTILSSLAVGTLGIIIALAYISYGYGAVILFFGPLLLARHSFKLYIEMRNLYISTIETLNKAIEAKDPYTSGHANRVQEYAVKLAESYGLSFEKVQNIKKAAILHDIGKIAVDDRILNKATKLSEEEFNQIRKHPSIGADIISKMDFLKVVSEIVRYHHERYDGNGYPEGLKGDSIPLEACILAIADSYDAMTTDRPYRKALDKELALEEIMKNAGSQFHPVLAEKFVSIMSK